MAASVGSGLLAGVLLLLALLLPAAAAAERGRSVEYLYIEANEGGSSGGHAALRLGDEVFHFQHQAPGVLVLGRDGFEGFRHRYSVLENRAIHVSRIPVAEETYDLLLARFRRRLFVQSRQLDVLEGLREDGRTLEQMRAGALSLEAAGFFFADGDVGPEAADGREDPALADLRVRIEAVHGAGFLDRRIEILREKLGELDPAVLDLPEPPATAAEMPAPTYSFPRRYRDLAGALTALEVLRRARPLRPDSARLGGADALVFTDTDAETARRLSDALATALVRLVASDRPDGGTPLLIGMARLAALGESRRTGRWVLLDVFPADAGVVPRQRLSARPDMAAALRDDAVDELARARARLVARAEDGAFHEVEFAAFESAANRFEELRGALEEGHALRVYKGPLVPSRSALVAVAGQDSEILRRSLEAVSGRHQSHAAAFRRHWGYHVVTRNCVSEIFGEIDAAFEGGALESARRLGGRLEMAGSLNFIPAVSAVGVASVYPVTEQVELPSYRRWRLERMYERENPVAVFLRESNTLSSAIYRRNPDDSVFVFFTDNALVLRPLFGAVNLATGLAASAVGLLALPVDGGALLRAGITGALFSLPELFFQNIRKGSFEYLRRNVGVAEPVPRPGAGRDGG